MTVFTSLTLNFLSFVAILLTDWTWEFHKCELPMWSQRWSLSSLAAKFTSLRISPTLFCERRTEYNDSNRTCQCVHKKYLNKAFNSFGVLDYDLCSCFTYYYLPCLHTSWILVVLNKLNRSKKPNLYNYETQKNHSSKLHKKNNYREFSYNVI